MIVERIPLSDHNPFDVQDLAFHCRVDGIGEFLPELQSQGLAAAAELESYAQIALLFQTIRVSLPSWRSCWREGRPMSLPIGPVVEGATATMTAGGEPVTVSLHSGPRPQIRCFADVPPGEVVIEYRAGYGDEHWSIPADLRHALMDQVSALFDGRGEGDGKTNRMSPHMARIAARYRRVRL